MALRLALLLSLTACAASSVRAHRTELNHARPAPPASTAESRSGDSPAPEAPSPILEGSLAHYQARAAAEAPQVQAAWARWKSSVEQVGVAGRLPEPVVSYGRFLSEIETRVGPQRNRIGISQALPWPGAVKAGIDAASERARAQEQEFEASLFEVGERVAIAYWRLWQVRAERELLEKWLEIDQDLLDLERRRVELGEIPLAALTRRETASLRLADRLDALLETERTAQASLRAAIGMQGDEPTPTTSSPQGARLPAQDTAALRALAEAHPRITALGRRADASQLDARQRQSDRLPSLVLSGDWIEVGPARLDGVPDSGKDVAMLGVAVRLPLAARSYRSAIDAAQADAAAWRAQARQTSLQASAELEAALSRVRDSARRIRLLDEQLLPRARDAVDSLQAMQTAQAARQALEARAEIVALQLELSTVQAEHETAWAALARIVGQDVPATTEAP